MTLDYLLDTVYEELRKLFPNSQILDVGDRTVFRGQDFMEVEVPLVTYSVRFELHPERVLDFITEKDLEAYTASIQEEVPYKMHIYIGLHSDIEREADEMAQTLLRGWGYAPRLGATPDDEDAGFGCYLEDFERLGVQDFGVASRVFHYVSWVRLDGRVEEVPLVRRVDYTVEPVICERAETAEKETFSVESQ